MDRAAHHYELQQGLDRVLGRVRDALLAASHRSAAAPPQAAAKDSA